ncbi:MAG: hypothetical protein LBU04_01140 [Christensenellaceae bacterium]|jgi:hypothetical protein|nr:hypothetical protein [Christensenellaceae bacterium]
MAKPDFDKYLTALRITIAEDTIALKKLRHAHAIGETDDVMLHATEKAFRDDQYKLECLLFVKGLLDKPRRKSKIEKWDKANKLPTKMPKKE